jgi:hypothetical protein
VIGFELGRTDVDQTAIHSLLHSQRGDVARYIRVLGNATVRLSKTFVHVRTGLLKRSITMRVDRDQPGGYAVLVGSDVTHALLHFTGSRPHVIRSKVPGGYMRFKGRGGMAFVRVVHHPGTHPNPYLLKALETVVK